MARPELSVIAEGELSSGASWVLRGGGSLDDFLTVIVVAGSDEIGFGGPVTEAGRKTNVCVGVGGAGQRWLLVRAIGGITGLRLEFADGTTADVSPVGTTTAPDVAHFAIELPSEVIAVTALDAHGMAEERTEFSMHRVVQPPLTSGAREGGGFHQVPAE